jgi:hypothetical protein
MAEQFPAIPPNWTVHGDDAPTFYVSGNPDPTTAGVRSLEKAAAQLTAVNPRTGKTDPLLVELATRTEMKALHMFTTGDPLRNPTFAFFGDPNYFLTDFPTNTCRTCINPGFAYNHGDIQPDIATTWLGVVGPGVERIDQRKAARIWSDHTDIQPTMLAYLGLQTSYQPDGAALVQLFDEDRLPRGLRGDDESLVRLQQAYKQLNAPFGSFGMSTLKGSTHGVVGDDATYASVDSRIADLTAQRDALAAQIRSAFYGAEFLGRRIGEQQARAWTRQAAALTAQAVAFGG